MKFLENPFSNRCFHVVFSFIVFFAVSVPFRYFFSVAEGVTDVRPAVAFQVFFGMTFALRGALGCALANFAADMIFGTELLMALLSFPIQILLSYIPYCLWYYTFR